jgi:signal peptidase I
MNENVASDDVYQLAARQATYPAKPSGLLLLTVTSDSMRPLLRTGDEVVVIPIDPRTLRPGMVIVVDRNGDWITHRLVTIDERGWHTQGDNTHILDAAARADEIVGRVITITRGAQTIDLRQPRWDAIERRINRVQRGQARVFGVLRRYSGGHANQLTRLSAALIHWPFQVAVRLLVRS